MLHEPVTVVTPHGQRAGYLFRGRDGLPELMIEAWLELESFRPATLPATWYLQPSEGQVDAPLLDAWDKIEAIQQELLEIEREAEREAQQERDEMNMAKADMEARGERSDE